VCNGKCYRLYTAAFFEREMAEAVVPEVQRTNMLTAVLYLKGLPFDIDVLAFDYLDSPGVRPSALCQRGPLEPAMERGCSVEEMICRML
jgi:HrpA-like RNA helicase